ncbi:MAG: TonB family protein [Betaproteobacteria bacterium]
MIEQAFEVLWRASALFSAACLLVLILRPLLVRFGARVAYASWLLVPSLLLVSIIPARSLFPATSTVHAWRIEAESIVVAALPIQSSVPAMLLGLWILGVLVVMAVVVRQHLRYVAGLRWDAAGGRWRAADARGPALLGLLRPNLVLPNNFEAQFDMQEQAMILAHEEVHRQRGDNVWNAIAIALVALQWFNVLAYFAWRRMRADQELACDATVMQCYPQRRPEYARALVKAQDASLAHSVACTWNSRHPLVERISMLAHKSPSKIVTRSGNAILVIAGLMAAAAVYAAQGVPAGGEVQAADTAAPAPYTNLKTAAICPNSRDALAEIRYPTAARADRTQADVLIDFTVTANGDITNIEVKSEPNAGFDNEAIAAVRRFKCNGQGRDARVRVPFSFRLTS